MRRCVIQKLSSEVTLRTTTIVPTIFAESLNLLNMRFLVSSMEWEAGLAAKAVLPGSLNPELTHLRAELFGKLRQFGRARLHLFPAMPNIGYGRVHGSNFLRDALRYMRRRGDALVRI